MKICVNEYIRTDKGTIAKIKDVEWDIIYTIAEMKPRYKHWVTEKQCYTEDIIKHSKNLIDLIEDEDIVILEYKSPKYRERITRRFEVSKIDDDIRFENSHCDFHCKVGDKKITDTICKNIKIKSIVTHKQFSNIEYKVEE